MSGGVFGMGFIREKIPNLGQNNACKRGKDYVKGEDRIGRGDTSSSLTYTSFPCLHMNGA